MAKETTHVPFDEFSNDLRGFFDRIIRGHETVMVEGDEGEVVIVKPAGLTRGTEGTRGTKHKRNRRNADREAFLASLGGWKDLVDTDKLVEDIYESRRISTRPPIRL